MAGSRIVVVGGGISGLTAAWQLLDSLPDADITVVDASDRPGGKCGVSRSPESPSTSALSRSWPDDPRGSP